MEYFNSRVKNATKDLEYLGGSFSLTDKACLDIGCGTGGKAFQFSQVARLVIGVDLSDQIKYANGYVKQNSNTNGHIHFAQANGCYLPFADNVFDIVFLLDAMEHISNPNLVIAESARVLSANGMMAIITPHYYGLSGDHLWNYFGSTFWRYAHLHLFIPDRLLKRLMLAIGKERNYSNQTIETEWLQHNTLNRLRPKNMKKLLEELGFHIEKYSYKKGKLLNRLRLKMEWLDELFSWGIVVVARKEKV